jgi:glycosyltransferase involved in cell wall biosynthesis
MKISIITPTFNSAKTISKNIESVLKQTHQNFEHIIIDNLSNDGTLDIVWKAYEIAGATAKLKIFSEKDQGISDAFNKGVQRAKGEIIGILNSDDFLFSDKSLLMIHSILELQAETSYVHGDMYFDDPALGSNKRTPLLCPVEYAMPFNHPTMYLRKNVYDVIGMFNVNYRYCMDLDLVCRIQAAGLKGHYLKETITVMCSGGTSDRNELKVLKEYANILKTHGKWNLSARKYFIEKDLRIKAKSILRMLNLEGLVKYWRFYKWRN